MTELEMRVDALMRLATAENAAAARKAKADIQTLMKSRIKNASTKEQAADAEAAVRKLFLELGAPDHLMGHPIAIRAVCLAIENEMYIRNITFGLYPQLAVEFDTVPARVERAIRHLIEVTWSRGDLDVFEKYFGNTTSPRRGRPSNGEFIARLANVVKFQLMTAE